MSEIDLQRIIPHIKRLPATPQLLPKLMQVLKDPNSSSEEIVNMIKLDMSVAAQVQRLSNSSYYGFPDPSRDLQQAITRIGMQETYKLVAAVLSQQLSGKQSGASGIDSKQLWEGSVACALSMEHLAYDLDIDEVNAYSIGLFHNIGLILINHAIGQEYKDVQVKVMKEEVNLLDAELEIMGFNHIQAGVLLMQQWKFPEEIYEPVNYQHKPMEAPTALRTSACMINIVHNIVASIGQIHGQAADAYPISEEAVKHLGFDEARIQTYTEEISVKVKNIKKLLKLAS